MNEITLSGHATNIHEFTDYVYDNKIFYYKILSHTINQSFSMVRHTVGKISHFEFGAFRVIHTGASDLKLFVGGVYVHNE